MSVTVGAVLKKVAVTLLSDRNVRKKLGVAAGTAVTVALLPALFLAALGGKLSEASTLSWDNNSEFAEMLSDSQKSLLVQDKMNGNIIEQQLSKLNLKEQTVKAQMIFMTYFKDTANFGGNFFAEYCGCFKEKDDKKLIALLTAKYKVNIGYEEFMRSYSVITNANINKYLFVNMNIKNNIDLAAWANNSCGTRWGCVPHADGNVLTEKKYSALKKKYPKEFSDKCYKWVGRRAVDNLSLLYSYLGYDPESREIKPDDFEKNVQELLSSADKKGDISSLPDTVGTVLANGDTLGIYVGDGNVVYAKSVEDGVVREEVSDGKWQSWFECPDIEYGQISSFNSDIKFEEYDPSQKNNLGLVQWAIEAHNNGWGYVYGTYGNVLTEDLLLDRAAACGCEVTDYMDFIRENWMGKRVADCVGLIKGYGWYDSKSGEIRVGSNGMADVGANAMFANAEIKGTIDTIPEVPGLAVWVDGHIGIYIGNGEVVEAMNTLRGVTRTQLAGREWTHWLQIPYIKYYKENKK